MEQDPIEPPTSLKEYEPPAQPEPMQTIEPLDSTAPPSPTIKEWIVGDGLNHPDIMDTSPTMKHPQLPLSEDLIPLAPPMKCQNTSTDNSCITTITIKDDTWEKALNTLKQGGPAPFKTQLSDWLVQGDRIFFKNCLYIPDNRELQ
ncbi:hypothetical protein NEOLEDRAFT_1182875 [Neolentinus lepideus HHB14362 ss-1]|uniref:Uncharacterized protein n=1 Tax=Neolentinus lepideus HHB14362 ss-1 TaxID=1314782 RepID=A0A165NSP0_9AGAM|nr:hypothetical protein NEOLEDRAFT_1182875 [Neolentinus lepideus HHB14362 ss-1]